MRTAAFTLLCIVAFGYAMNAQRFSLLPQVGFENSKTKLSYNDLSSFAPEGVKFTPQASLRLNYSSKQGHGFFVGAATSRSIISFSFADPENGMNNFSATAGTMQVRLEGGYQFSTKRIALNKSSQSGSNKSSAAKKSCGASSASTKSSCQRTYTYSCSGKSKSTQPALAKNNGVWMRIQPNAGMGFIPAVKTDVISKTQNNQTVYEYRAGNWQAGVIAGTNVEFGRRDMAKVIISINYFKGLSNLGTQSVTTPDAVKPVTTTLSSDVSGWNVRIGMPFSLSKSPAARAKAKAAKKAKEQKSHCQPYRATYRRCGMK